MPVRPCLGLPGQPCGRLTQRAGARCPACDRKREQARGSRQERGYGQAHDDIRAELLRRWKPGDLCGRCGQPMLAGQALDAGHPPDAPLRLDRSSRADRLEHAACNRAARD